MPDQSETNESPLTLSHAEAVRRLNATIVRIHEAREVCHRRLERAVRGPDKQRAVSDALEAADDYGRGLELLFNTLVELKVLHPAAWDESNGGKMQRAMEAAIQEMVMDSLALVFGIGWPGGDGSRAGGQEGA